jgi:hypothetical protein
MPTANKFLITTESHEYIVVRRPGSERPVRHCASCGADVTGLTLDEAVTVTGASGFTLLGLARAGKVHLMESPTGHLLVCGESLIPVMNKEERENE